MGRADELLEELQQILDPDQKSKCGVSGCDRPEMGWTEVVHISVLTRPHNDLSRSVTIPICERHTNKLTGRQDAR